MSSKPQVTAKVSRFPDCPLCAAEADKPNQRLLVDLWFAYKPGSKKPWSDVARVLQRSDEAWTVEQVRKHYHRHHAAQPNPSHRRAAKQAELVLPSLSGLQLDILRLVERLQVVSIEQVKGWFYTRPGVTEPSALRLVMTALAVLRHHGLLYREWRVGKAWDEGSVQSVHALGRVGSQVLELVFEAEGFEHRDVGYAPSRGVDQYRLGHDLGAMDCLLSLHRSGDSELQLGKDQVRASISPSNIFTARTLAYDFRTPQYLNEFRELQAAGHHTLVSDAFAVVAVSQAKDTSKNFAVPFTLEYDTGNRKVPPVAEQLINYLWLDRSRSVQARFPQLALEGQSIPMVFATQNWAGGSGRQRRATLRDQVMELLEARGLLGKLDQSPIYMVLNKDIKAHGLKAPALSLWDEWDGATEHGPTLFEQLVRSNWELARSGKLKADTLLLPDRKAARPRTVVTEGMSASERQAKQEQREREQAEFEARNARHLAQQAEQERMLKEAQEQLARAGGGR